MPPQQLRNQSSVLRILLIEDSPVDAMQIEHELQAGGIDAAITRVEAETEVRAEFFNGHDLVMADFCMPGFTAMDVLDWFKQSGTDVPFILVSGTIDAEAAVASMRKGADDYILKRNLASLPAAVHRAMEAHRMRREKRSAEDKVSFLARMLNLAHDAIIVCDFDRQGILYWNMGAERLYGWTASESIGRNFHEVISLTEGEACAVMKSLLRCGEWSAEGYRRRRDGQKMIVSERATLSRDAEGNPTAVLFIHTDITERKRTEKQIHQQEAIMREAGEMAHLGSWEFEVLQNKVSWTPEVARVFGLAPNHVATLDLCLGFLQGEHRQSFETAFQAAVEAATPYDLELEISAADGVRRWVRAVGHSVLEEEKVVRVCGIFQDITSRKHAEDQLRNQAHLLDLTSDAILVSDYATGKILYWNCGAERMHGWTAEEAIGEQASELLLQDPEVGEGILREVSLSGAWNGELRERTRDGREIIVSSRVTLVRGEPGQPKSLLSIHTDVTEQKLIEAQFLRAQRLESVGTLASGIAHDLNNILSPIVMAGPLLNDDLPPETRKSIVNTINISARRGVEIVRQVLTFARGVKGRQAPVNCEKLIREIASITSETFPKSIAIGTKAKPGLWSALGDSTQLQQVLLNLAINARDAMPAGGTLNISARNFAVDEALASVTHGARVGRYVLLQVTDTGTGIPMAVMDKIFDPFFSTKEVGQGTGLGLSTVVGIVKNHSGFITVDSELGKGTTFKVYIPASNDGSTDELTSEEEAPGPRGHGETVLFVDDEESIRSVGDLALTQQAGYRVLLAADGPQALALYAEHRATIKVVVTDTIMPLLDGVDLTRVLRNLNPDVKVIGTSGISDEQRVSEFKALGLKGFLTKPFSTHTLLGSLEQVLHSSPS